MSHKFLTLSEINLEGNFLGFMGDNPRKFKYLRLEISSGDVLVKLPKELRSSLGLSLRLGEQIQVYGVSKLNTRTGEVKLKAYQVKQADNCQNQDILSPQIAAKIKVCQKSGCLKRGGQDLLSELEQILRDRGLLDKVTIERTGCQKCCGSAPNCVLQLGNKKYKNIHPEAIASLLESHLSNLDND